MLLGIVSLRAGKKIDLRRREHARHQRRHRERLPDPGAAPGLVLAVARFRPAPRGRRGVQPGPPVGPGRTPTPRGYSMRRTCDVRWSVRTSSSGFCTDIVGPAGATVSAEWSSACFGSSRNTIAALRPSNRGPAADWSRRNSPVDAAESSVMCLPSNTGNGGKEEPMRAMACLIVSASVLLSSAPGRASQAPACASPANQVVAENCKPGTSADRVGRQRLGRPEHPGLRHRHQRQPRRDDRVQGRQPPPAYRIDIYRLGYYGGVGARQIATIKPSVALPQTQPPCLTDCRDRLSTAATGRCRPRGRCRATPCPASTSPGSCAKTTSRRRGRPTTDASTRRAKPNPFRTPMARSGSVRSPMR